MTVKYPTTDLMHLEEDAQAVARYVRALNDDQTDPDEARKLMFRIGLRLMRIESEAAQVGKFVDALAEEAGQ